MHYWDNGWDGGWPVGLFMAIIMLLIIGGLIAVAVILIRRTTTRPHTVHGGSAQHILDERYARGEIDEEEYRRRRGILQEGNPPAK
jgi:putative membrane protein